MSEKSVIQASNTIFDLNKTEKNDNFERPVLVLKNFENIFLLEPLTSQEKSGKFYTLFLEKAIFPPLFYRKFDLLIAKELFEKFDIFRKIIFKF